MGSFVLVATVAVTGIPKAFIHVRDAAVDRDQFVFGNAPVAEFEGLVSGAAEREERGVESEGLGVDGLEERLAADGVDVHRLVFW